MLKYFRLPLLFLFIASAIGVFLRWQFISPTPGVNYTFILHAHSHIMFLGWVFNALYIAFTISYVEHGEHKIFQNLFIVLQFLIVGMMISFPLEGYGLYSILFSTLHTFGAILFVILFYKKTKHATTISIWYARTALIFFTISTLGPFSLGYLMSNGMGQSQWYYFSIYYYLHFQYNGFFIFGIFSLFFGFLERKEIQYNLEKAKGIGKLMAFSCVPAYLLSILWSKPGLTFNVIGGLAAIIQLFAFAEFFRLLKINRKAIQHSICKYSYLYLFIVLIAFALKLLLQFLSSHPHLAQLAYELRPVVIAYLHLVLLGVISLFLFSWYLEMNFIGKTSGKKILILFLISFTGMETCLVLTPWWSTISRYLLLSATQCIFFFSVLLFLSCFLLFCSSLTKKPDKNHVLN